MRFLQAPNRTNVGRISCRSSEYCHKSRKSLQLSYPSSALTEVQYGEIDIKVQAGKAQWIDKTERERVG